MRIGFITLVCFLSFPRLMASASGLVINDIQVLNQKLQKLDAGWYANDNWLNHLPHQDLKKMMGLRDTPPTDVEFTSATPPKVLSLPAVIDWRNYRGQNWVSPILNQGNCGSCVAFAAVGVMETQLNIASLFPQMNARLSPQNLFSCGGGACDYGWYPGSAAERLMTDGIPDEACLPYTSGATGADVACEETCRDTARRSRKIVNYASPTRSLTNISEVKNALQRGPLMTTLTVYADFMSYAGGVYKHTTGDMMGGHAVSIVGYDDVTQSYIIRNSWGEEWGEKGFAHVAYSDTSGIGRSTWGFEIPPVAGAIAVMSPRDYSYISGAFEISVQSTFEQGRNLALKVYSIDGKIVWNGSCLQQGSVCKSSFASESVADGRYEFEAEALNDKGEVLGISGRQFFYVANKKPDLKVSFTGGPGLDLDKEVNGRIEFAVTSSTSSVPMNSLQFYVRSPSGKATVRTAQLVLPSMLVGWRTKLVENGSYEVWFVGQMKTNRLEAKVESSHRVVRVKN